MQDDVPLMDRNPLPDGIPERLAAQLRFVAEVDKLKTVLRASPLAAADCRENDAEHSWHLALMIIVLAEYADEPIDVGHAIKPAVVHDLVEIYAGDSPVYEPGAADDQMARERRAADLLFGQLPTEQGIEMRELWDEFELGKTPEARFGRAMDRLEPMMLNWLNDGGTWHMPGASATTVRARAAGIGAASTGLGEASDRLIDEGLGRGWIRPD